MARESGLLRYRAWYARLLRLYPKAFRERFGESMQQTFDDLCRERGGVGGTPLAFALRIFADTLAAIFRERIFTMRTSHVMRIALVAGSILMIPLVAMRFTDEVKWTFFDFAFAGAMLFGTGFAYELLTRRSGVIAYRAAAAVALAAALALVWINAAVGIIGSENNPANLLYGGVLATGAIGSALARLQPRGMAKTMVAAAAVQMLVPVVALIFWRASFAEPPGTAGIFVLNAGFALLLVTSALLFRRAAQPRLAG